MRKILLALAATAGLAGLASTGASAAPAMPLHAPVAASGVQQADWYCGPRCRYWHHRQWESRHHYRGHRYPSYGYNYNYSHGQPYYR